MSIKKVIDALKHYKSFLITTHTNMEGDALGSELALYYLLQNLNKKAMIVDDDVIPYGYDFLPLIDRIQRFSCKRKIEPFECLCVVDCSDISRTGQIQSIFSSTKEIINIDHHISNSCFGTINYVDSQASCCCELIWRIYKTAKVKLDYTSAILLYTGILTDTGSFRYTNTNEKTHKIVAELLSFGINPTQVYQQVYGRIPLGDMKILIKILPTMRTFYNGKLVTFEIRRLVFPHHYKVSVDLTEYVLSFGRGLQGAEVVVLFKENLSESSQIRVNFRSQGRIDVNHIAQFFGGGGHTTASGATILGSLSSVKKRVIRYLGRFLKKVN
ncbi:MAG: bifunctional oligoribonuclease/PAP phosphatase NrnA [Candidatus Omnitrophica bacterium]|nr:bifunctional oligoribonuclease/PAP phosphatase NrnA [Candidatus Omnitrophota bacterium]